MDTGVDLPTLKAKHYIEMKYKKVPITQAIAKVMADLDITEESQRMDDYIEWASEAVELIGAPMQLETVALHKSIDGPSEVKGYQCRIPNDAVNILSVYYNETKNNPFRKIEKSTSLSMKSKMQSKDVFYAYKPGYIYLNRKTGFIDMVYQRHEKDSDGFILIPDLMSYIEAIYWYIVMKLTYPQWRKGLVRDNIYYDAKRSWNFFKNKAYGEMMMPTLDDMKNIRDSFNRLVPVMDAESSDFESINYREKVRF